MTITIATLAIACVDGVVGALTLWLVLSLINHLRKDGKP